MRTAQLLSAAVLLLVAACGADKKPAQAPDPIVSNNSAQADMPPSPSEKTSETTTPAEKPATNDAQTLAIKVAPMKLVPAKAGKNDKPVELKADGTITVGGKAVAKIAGDQIDALDGSGTLVTVAMDGSLVGQGIKPGFKFVGDELQGDNGTKLSIGDDGAINATNKDGKSEVMGKMEGGENAKRAGVLVTMLMLVAKPVETTPAPAKKK